MMFVKALETSAYTLPHVVCVCVCVCVCRMHVMWNPQSEASSWKPVLFPSSDVCELRTAVTHFYSNTRWSRSRYWFMTDRVMMVMSSGNRGEFQRTPGFPVNARVSAHWRRRLVTRRIAASLVR